MENNNIKKKGRTNPWTRRIRKSVLGVEKVEQEEERAQKRREKRRRTRTTLTRNTRKFSSWMQKCRTRRRIWAEKEHVQHKTKRTIFFLGVRKVEQEEEEHEQERTKSTTRPQKTRKMWSWSWKSRITGTRTWKEEKVQQELQAQEILVSS